MASATGEFEAGFDAGGQTREHAILIRSLGVTQLLVAVNKLDTVSFFPTCDEPRASDDQPCSRLFNASTLLSRAKDVRRDVAKKA